MTPQTRTVRFLGCFALLGLFGCAHDRAAPSAAASNHEVLISQRSTAADDVWEAATDVLRGHGYRLDRVDRSAGLITTMPRTSQQAFEFWRDDVCTSADLWEATINPIRRWAEVQLAQDDAGAWRDIGVIVHKERFSSPDRQFNSTGAAYQFFGNQLPSTSGAPEVSPADERWLDIGRDTAMEACLIQQILESAKLRDAAMTPDDPPARTDPRAG